MKKNLSKIIVVFSLAFMVMTVGLTVSAVDTVIPSNVLSADNIYINDITAGDTTITGNAEPYASLTVTFPSGDTEVTTVNEDGTWSLAVPATVTLNGGDRVRINQTLVSVTYSSTDTVENITNPGGAYNLGDTIQYTFTLTSEQLGSTMYDTVFHSPVVTNLSFVDGSVVINGTAATAEEYSYDAETRVLNTFIGNIEGESTITVSYQATVDAGPSVLFTTIVDYQVGGSDRVADMVVLPDGTTPTPNPTDNTVLYILLATILGLLVIISVFLYMNLLRRRI